MEYIDQIFNEDCLEGVKKLPDQSVDCCITSPPYYGLRDYGCDGQIGLEESPDEYVQKLVSLFHEVKRVLKDDGTFWLNIGDSWYHTTSNNGGTSSSSTLNGADNPNCKVRVQHDIGQRRKLNMAGLKPKDIIGIPWKLAFALRDDGWYLRQDIIWQKPDPMPESVLDRCTKSHEYIFFLTKKPRYFFDNVAIQEPAITAEEGKKAFRNKRDVWSVCTPVEKEAHFATFNPDLIKPCVLAGCRPGGVVLDPFMGSGTTAKVAIECNRHYVGFELNPKYIEIIKRKIQTTPDLFY